MKYLFEWTSDMSVNQTEIDAQHKELFNQMNILMSAIINHMELGVTENAMKFLGNYIEGHLKYEEEYMSKNGYPDLDQHKVEHKDFIDNYEKLKEKRIYDVPVDEIVSEIEIFLGNWLIKHIGHSDQKYATYIKQKNLKTA
jgi:hemerythrin